MEENVNYSWINIFEKVLDKICGLSDDNFEASRILYDYYTCLPNPGFDYDNYKKMEPLTYIACASKSKGSRIHLISEFELSDEFKANKVTGIPSFYNEGQEWVYSRELWLHKTKDNDNTIFDNFWNFARELNKGKLDKKLFNKLLTYYKITTLTLSKIIFICKPKIFFSYDKNMQAYTKQANVSDYDSYEQYQEFCKKEYKDIMPYEISHKAYLFNKNKDATPTEQIKKEGEEGEKELSKQPLNQILYGPPGTGKTYNTIIKTMEIIGIPESNKEGHSALQTILNAQKADTPKNTDKEYKIIKKEFDKLKDLKQIEFITFHQSYSYEEFVEGIKPEVDWEANTNKKNKDIRYIGKKGIFREICDRASQHNENNYVLIIDEINRGNISKIFGELITLIEEDKRENVTGEDKEYNTIQVTLPYSGDTFTVPNNLYIIGTMNTADRSIALLDTALRRRFEFEEMPSRPELLDKEAKFIVDGVEKTLDLENLLIKLNENIKKAGKDKNYFIGHAFLININNDNEKLRRAFLNKIYPLLEEYFYGEEETIKDVLNIKENIKDTDLSDYVKKHWDTILENLANEKS